MDSAEPTPADDSQPRDEGLIAIVAAALEREPHVSTWPADEQALFRNYSAWHSFTDRHEKLQRLRAAKLIALIREHDGRSMPL